MAAKTIPPEAPRDCPLCPRLVDYRHTNAAACYVGNGRVVIAHCTAFENGNGTANSLFVSEETSQVEVLNSIFWNKGYVTKELQVSSGGFARSTRSIFYGSGPAGVLVRRPFLNPNGFLTATSAARNLGVAGTKTDAQGKLRDTSPDAGADEFIDSDNDGLPDWVEALGATTPGGTWMRTERRIFTNT